MKIRCWVFALLLLPLAACTPERMSLNQSCDEYLALTASSGVRQLDSVQVYEDLTESMERMHEAVAKQVEVARDVYLSAEPDITFSDEEYYEMADAQDRLRAMCGAS